MDDTILVQTAVRLTQIIVPIFIVLGTLGNIVNILILTRKRLRGYACSLYFVALSVNNLFYSTVLLITNLLGDGYGIKPAARSNALCKISSYFLNLCPLLAVFYIVLASIDRCCSSSANVRTRRFSQIRIAKVSISIVTVVIAVLMIGVLIGFEVRDDGAGCTARPDRLFNQVFLFMEVMLYAIIGPCLMIIFGSLTIYNASRIGHNRANVSQNRRTEKELARMLIVQVSSHILLSAPFCVMFVLLVIPTPIRYTVRFFAIYILCKIPIYMTYRSSFFLYILSGSIYREELVQLVRKLFRTSATVAPGRINPVASVQTTTV